MAFCSDDIILSTYAKIKNLKRLTFKKMNPYFYYVHAFRK